MKPMKCTKNKDILMVSLTVIGRVMYEFGLDVVKWEWEVAIEEAHLRISTVKECSNVKDVLTTRAMTNTTLQTLAMVLNVIVNSIMNNQ